MFAHHLGLKPAEVYELELDELLDLVEYCEALQASAARSAAAADH